MKHGGGSLARSGSRLTLLLPRTPSERLLEQLGYDLVAFAANTHHSLGAVVERARTLYLPYSWPQVAIGIWLFAVRGGASGRAGQHAGVTWSRTAFLGGIEMEHWDVHLFRAWQVPDAVRDAAMRALAERTPGTSTIAGAGMFRWKYLISAEPLFVGEHVGPCTRPRFETIAGNGRHRGWTACRWPTGAPLRPLLGQRAVTDVPQMAWNLRTPTSV